MDFDPIAAADLLIRIAQALGLPSTLSPPEKEATRSSTPDPRFDMIQRELEELTDIVENFKRTRNESYSAPEQDELRARLASKALTLLQRIGWDKNPPNTQWQQFREYLERCRNI